MGRYFLHVRETWPLRADTWAALYGASMGTETTLKNRGSEWAHVIPKQRCVREMATSQRAKIAREAEGSNGICPKPSGPQLGNIPQAPWSSGLWHQVWGVLSTWGASLDSRMGNLLRSTCPTGDVQGCIVRPQRQD